jgi:preprotein translocase subunit SecF
MAKRGHGLRRRLTSIAILTAIVWQFREGTFLNYGVDFTGGTLVQVEFPAGDVEIGDVRAALDVPGIAVTSFGGTSEFLIRTPQAPEGAVDAADPANIVQQQLTEAFGPGSYRVERVEAVGAKVGGEMQTRAIIAILLSFAATMIYLAFRFEWRFGVAAVVATFHDIMLTLGFIAILRLDVSLPTVAAVLTIVGYSLNDTIVIFDRVRENLKAAGRRDSMQDIANRSINETLPRTVVTSATTMAVLFSLFLFGGVIVREFALILIVGIALGTYSSIFVAAPALLEVERRWPREKARPMAEKASQAWSRKSSLWLSLSQTGSRNTVLSRRPSRRIRSSVSFSPICTGAVSVSCGR